MDYDLCVIGGGINGTGIARDAAGRGLSVLLVEAQDLASATSSASTKLIHGGLRYLEHYEFRLVRESLKEREVLLKAAPHIIWPKKFILPHDDHLRPYWMIKAGLFLYDHLGGRKKLLKSSALDFATSPLTDLLEKKYLRGFSYYDCWVEDSRLVVLNAVDAFERGAIIMPRTACVFLEPTRNKKAWQVHLQNTLNGDEFHVSARMIVNAGGPWVRNFLEGSQLVENEKKDQAYVPDVRLIKGSHIIIDRLYEGDHAFILQQEDGRIVFTIPYEDKFTLIGTTDVPFGEDVSKVMIEPSEVEYLCAAVNHYFKKKISAENVIWTYSGVRALVDDGKDNASKITRDYKLYMDERFGPPILSVFGGKITTYRKLSEHVVDRLATFYSDKKMTAWTENIPLPGGDIPNGDFESYLQKQVARYTFMPQKTLYRYARAYGTRMDAILEGATKTADLGQHFGDHVYEAEIMHLLRYEFAHMIEDILWRRSKLGLHIKDETVQAIEKKLPELIQKIKLENDHYENAAGY